MRCTVFLIRLMRYPSFFGFNLFFLFRGRRRPGYPLPDRGFRLLLLFRGRRRPCYPLPDRGFRLLLLFRGRRRPCYPIPDRGFRLFLLFRGQIRTGYPIPDRGFHSLLLFRGQISPGYPLPDRGFRLLFLFRGQASANAIKITLFRIKKDDNLLFIIFFLLYAISLFICVLLSDYSHCIFHTLNIVLHIWHAFFSILSTQLDDCTSYNRSI